MTTSKIWALILSLILVGGGIIGGVVWRQNHPDAPEFGRLVDPLVPRLPDAGKPPNPDTKAPETKVPETKGPDSKTADTRAAEPAPKAVQPLEKNAGGAELTPRTDKPQDKDKQKKDKTAEPPSGAGEPPHFDVVRVEPSGDAVVAGKGDPNAKVALVESGKVVAETKADSAGNFVILPPSLKPGDHDLSLRQSTDGKPAADSTQNVAVSVPKKSGDQVVVALAEPGKPTKLLSPPPNAPSTGAAANAPSPAEQKPAGADVAVAKPETAQPGTNLAPPAAIAPKGPDLAIRTVELENGNGFYATGVATPGTKLEIYLNGAHLAAVVAGKDGQWSLTIKRGLAGGRYAVRADAIGDGKKVVARVEVPFDVPTALAQAPDSSEAPKPSEAARPSAPAVEAPAPPSAPNPSEVAGLGPEPSLAEPPPGDIQPMVPTPRPDIAAAAKAAAQAAPKKAPPTLAMAPPAATSAPNAVPTPAPPPTARVAPAAPAKMAIAPAKPADAPPTIAATKPAVAPPKRAEAAVAVGAKPVDTKPVAECRAAPAAVAGRPASPAPASPAKVAAVPTPAPAPAAPPADPSNAVIEQVETALVIRGDNLWNISRARLGNATRYTQIYAANNDQIRNPDLIYPGQVFVMPQR